MSKRQVTLIPGDGIGPEVVASARQLIDATGVGIEWIEAEAGASVFKKGIASGVPKDTIEAISKTRVALKGPLETPVGYGEKSANVTLRKLFETFGNLRPVRELPGVPTPYSGRGVDLIVVRENVEDLYAGIEHMQTPTVAQCLKLISAKGCEKIVRLAFEVARAEGRKSVHCATKANIMKLTEGMLKRTFERIAPEYPDIQASHIIIDNCAHQLVKKPEQFEVIVTTNMNGDIISDLSSALIGGLGFAPSANIGHDVAIFEAVHGSAPKYAGKDVINPTAMILSGVMMLRYLEEFEAAALIENAVLATLQEGKSLTRDVVGDARAVGTKAFTAAILANFGKRPSGVTPRVYRPLKVPRVVENPPPPRQRGLVGVDVFVEAALSPVEVGQKMEAAAAGTDFKLKMVSNRGTMVYPPTGAQTDCVDHWRCRFLMPSGDESRCTAQLTQLLRQVEAAGLRWMHIEKLPQFDGARGYTMAQGED
ncbi:MAG: NADP-dependent isocitrate dehydrogenase [Verrucomicrobiae bacterium]|nr:NADP-dependent isocitrate dehydrogenase [Verrucomicrobiae bacterium]MDW8310185.1 NADP-dependent isocitrate dehydrogenase [Verrucomicrobiales bacterium]